MTADATGEGAARAVHDAVAATLAELERDLAPMIDLLGAAAQESYEQCRTRWDDAVVTLSQVLTTISQAVGQANDGYRTTTRPTPG